VSLIAEHLITALRKRLPADAGPELDAYEQRARALGDDRRAELKRAYACARWSVDVVGDPARSGLVADVTRAAEAVKEIGQAVWAQLGADVENIVARLFPGKTGADYLGMWVGVENPAQAPGTGASPLVGPEIAWVVEAVEVAEKVAESDGWDAVPWRRLLDEVVSG
jgi:hypothetical protein